MGDSTTLKQKESFFSKQNLIAYALLIGGSILFAIGDVMFANPYHLAPGGTYGLSNVLNSVWPWKISYYAACMDIPLLIIGTLILGPKFGVKTIVSTFVILGAVWLLEHKLWGYDPVIHDGMLEGVIAEKGGLNFVPDYFLNTLVAGLIYGVAIGMIFKSGATSGGSDIISMILHKYTRISLGTLVMIVDTCITLTTLVAFGQIRLPIYSIIVILIEGKIIDLVVEGLKQYKTVLIVSDRYDDVRELIINEIKRGATLVNCKGMYENKERSLIYTSLGRKEFIALKERLAQIDPDAFVNVVDSCEIMGKGFKKLGF